MDSYVCCPHFASLTPSAHANFIFSPSVRRSSDRNKNTDTIDFEAFHSILLSFPYKREINDNEQTYSSASSDRAERNSILKTGNLESYLTFFRQMFNQAIQLRFQCSSKQQPTADICEIGKICSVDPTFICRQINWKINPNNFSFLSWQQSLSGGHQARQVVHRYRITLYAQFMYFTLRRLARSFIWILKFLNLERRRDRTSRSVDMTRWPNFRNLEIIEIIMLNTLPERLKPSFERMLK